MLKKIFRLPIQNWMKDKKNKTITIKGDFFMARVRSNNENFCRFGIIVSAKIFKGAICRNRIKRKIFEFIRMNKLVEKFSGKDILLSVLPQAIGVQEKTIIQSLPLFLNKIIK